MTQYGTDREKHSPYGITPTNKNYFTNYQNLKFKTKMLQSQIK